MSIYRHSPEFDPPAQLYLIWVEFHILPQAHLQHLLHPLFQHLEGAGGHQDIVDILIDARLSAQLLISTDVKVVTADGCPLG